MPITDEKQTGPYFEVYPSSGEFRWRLYSRNGRILASGESFKNKKDCLHSIEIIKTVAGFAETVDLTEQPVRANNSVPHRKKYGGKKS